MSLSSDSEFWNWIVCAGVSLMGKPRSQEQLDEEVENANSWLYRELRQRLPEGTQLLGYKDPQQVPGVNLALSVSLDVDDIRVHGRMEQRVLGMVDTVARAAADAMYVRARLKRNAFLLLIDAIITTSREEPVPGPLPPATDDVLAEIVPLSLDQLTDQAGREAQRQAEEIYQTLICGAGVPEHILRPNKP